MSHILHIPVDATVSDIAKAISGVRAQRIALLFAPGVRADLAEPHTLQLLRAFCDELEKDVAVIGGGERLRAAAVAAGFAAALALDDWHTEPELSAVRPGVPQPTKPSRPRRLLRRRRAAQARQTQQQSEWEEIALLPDDADWDGIQDEVEYWEEELPPYVRTLVRTEGSFSGLHDETPAERARLPRITRPLRELSEDEALRQADENHEERMTLTIRDTASHSAVHLPTAEHKHSGSAHCEPPAP